METTQFKDHYENDNVRNNKPYAINTTDNEFELMKWKLKIYSIERRVIEILGLCGTEDKVKACELIKDTCWKILGEEK